MYEVAIIILKKINELGYEAYMVGGFPRDQYLKRNIVDIDLCSNILEEKLMQHFNVIQKSNYGSFVILENDYEFEITLFRKEYYQNSRYPKIEYISSLKEDLQRRDFTMNTLCIDSTGNYVDMMNAKRDMDQKTVKVVGDVKQKIEEDPLRIIRAIRFAADLDFTLEKSLWDFIKNNGILLENITQSKIQKEIEKVKNRKKLDELIKALDLEKYIR